MNPLDLLRLAGNGLGSRRFRTALTSIGIAVGVGSIVAIFGISASSRAAVLDELDRLGTNLLAVQAKDGLLPGQKSGLPATAGERLGRIPAVDQHAAVYPIEAAVSRNDVVPAGRNGGVTSAAVDHSLHDTLAATVAEGRFLVAGDGDLPRVVLGSEAAVRLGVVRLGHRPAVVVGGHRFAVVGILDPLPLNPDVDRMVLMGPAVAEHVLDADLTADTVFFRVGKPHVEVVSTVAARTVNPAAPDSVAVSRPSEALEVQASVDSALTRLLIGLGSVALLVGAIGIANVMAIAVVERRTEIGLRRALGATRVNIALQFVAESSVLAGIGALIGLVGGALMVVGYSSYQEWQVMIPVSGLAVVAAGAVVIGAVAGLYPAVRASRLDPAEAVRMHP